MLARSGYLARKVFSSFSKKPQEEKSADTELHIAVNLLMLHEVRRLLRSGLSPNAPGKNGKTPLQIAKAKKYCQTPEGKKILRELLAVALRDAIQNGDMKTARRLIRKPADANKLNVNFRRPLAEAISSRNTGMIDLLLKKNADPEAISVGKNTSLHLAAYYGLDDPALVKPFLTGNLEQRNQGGNTPLFSAIYSRNPKVTVLLVASRADVNAINNANLSCLDVAEQRGNRKIIALLKNSNAKHASEITPQPLPVPVSLKGLFQFSPLHDNYLEDHCIESPRPS